MSWDHSALLAKAKLFFERALSQDRDGAEFGLWCSLGLELLAKAALSKISPALIAESDSEHRHLLHALGHGGKGVPKSIGAIKAFVLCRQVIPHFTEQCLTTSTALADRRNGELHSGEAAFEQFKTEAWLVGFYEACRVLSFAVGESFDRVLGVEEAKNAVKVLAVKKETVLKSVLDRVSQCHKEFEAKTPEERETLSKQATERVERLTREHRHGVTCPACKCHAVVAGETFGATVVEHTEEEIIEKQPVSPKTFECFACGLVLIEYAELEAVNLGGTYMRTSTYSPGEYYGLVDLDTIDIDEMYYERHYGGDYDNE